METSHNGNPWKGLASYTYRDAEQFYGRDRELSEIASVIKSNAFTTLYGISGAGKTSIINAGLIPLLDKQTFLPIYIRLDHNSGHAPYDVQIINSVTNALVSVGAEAECFVHQNVNSNLDKLWLYFHSHKFWSIDNHQLSPIIFIDQFEEIFTKNENPEDIWAFFEMIDSLQYSTPTARILQAMESGDQFVSFGEEQNFRMVFSMREDFLARLEDYSFNIPALRKNRIGLKPLNGLQALDVILKPRPDMVTRKVALHIVSKIVGRTVSDNERRLEATTVDTSMLSLFCTELYNYATSDKKGIITIELVNLYGDNILEWFYDRNMQLLPKDTYIYLENQLLTPSGFRNSVALDTLKDKGIRTEQLEALAENRIIRIEEVNHNMRVEFTHDVLCQIAKKRRGERDKLAKLKDEQVALKEFTIANVVIFASLALFAFSLFYSGIGDGFLVFLWIFPILSTLYAIIAGKSIADNNLSKVLGGFLLAVGIECTAMYVKYRLDLNNSYFLKCIFVFIPISLLLLPYIFLIKTSLQQKFKILGNQKYVILFCTLFLILQSMLVGISTTFTQIYFAFLPSLLVILTPIYTLYNNIKCKESKVFSIYALVYSAILISAIVLSVLYKNDLVDLSRKNETANIIAIIIVAFVFVLFCFLLSIQYTKISKQQSLTNYYKNVLSFQIFTKYKSFKTRLFTFVTCFLVLVFSLFATRYWDVLPFITLPLVCIMTLHVACSELKMIFSKSAIRVKILIPIVLFAEFIVASQYMIGELKMLVLYTAAIAMTILTSVYLVNKENLRKRYSFAVRAFAFSVVIGWVLPVLSLGYNVFNPSLTHISRVWGGALCSNNNTRLYFITIENEHGDKGLMDYSEIVVQPQYADVVNFVMSQDIFEKTYPVRSLLCSVLEIRYDALWGEAYEQNFESDLSIELRTQGNNVKKLDERYFLSFYNKYGQEYFKSIVKALTEPSVNLLNYAKCMSHLNVYTSDSEINQLIIKRIVHRLEEENNGYSLLAEYALDVARYDLNPTTKVYVDCYKGATLKNLLSHVDVLDFSHIHKVAKELNFLFMYDKSKELERVILDNLWDQLADKEAADIMTLVDKAELYMCAGNTDKALSIIKNVIQYDTLYEPIYYEALELLLMVLDNKKSDISSILNDMNRDSVLRVDKTKLYEGLASRIIGFENYGMTFNKEQILNNIEKLFSHRDYSLVEGQNFDRTKDYELLFGKSSH